MIDVIKYDANQAMTDFHKHLLTYVVQIRQELLLEAQQGMKTREGMDDLSEGEISAVLGLISTSVVGGAWATMDEWGTGSKMDTTNPDLGRYMGGKLWNPARFDTTIRGRPMGTYTNIFGETKHSSGRMEGLDLEGIFEPQQPSHALETAKRWMMNGRFQWLLNKAVSSFPWGKYLKVGG